MRMRLWRAIIAAAALAASLAVAANAPALAPSAREASGCRPAGRTLVHTPEVLVWRVLHPSRSGDRETVYACSRSRGRDHRLVSFYTGGGSIHQIRPAGHFVAFLHATDPTVTYLEMYDLWRGRDVIDEVSRCEGHSACPGFGTITAFALSPNGWLAQLNSTFLESGEALVASNGSDEVAVDYGLHIGGLSVSGTTLRWTPDGGGRSSAPLGPRIETPALAPTPIPSACVLVTAVDAGSVLGSLGPPGTMGPGNCGYASAADASRQLNFTEQTGLTPAQVMAAQTALDGGDLQQGGATDGIGGNQNKAFYGMTMIGGVQHEQVVSFFGGTELTVDLAPFRSNDDVAAQRLTVAAFDRLLGLPIRRAGAGGR